MGGGDAAASVSFPLWAWFVFGGLVVGLLFLDLFVLHRSARKIPFRESLRFTGFWVAVALAFGGFVWYLAGSEVAMEYLAAYLVEWSLSLDNVFVWAVIFTSFAVPEEYRYHVLLWGVMGALVFRATSSWSASPCFRPLAGSSSSSECFWSSRASECFGAAGTRHRTPRTTAH